MKIELRSNYCTLSREKNDNRLFHESTVCFYMKRLLNEAGFHFTRFNPSRNALTSCTLGLRDRKAKIVLWHECYQIENAATAFNNGSVTFQRINE